MVKKRNHIKTALVLTGGGSRGAVEVGAMKVIVNKYKIDAVIGTSIGAINAALYAGGCNPEEIEKIWLPVTTKMVFPFNWIFAIMPWKTRSISHTRGLRKFLNRVLPVKTFEECKIPLYINATEMLTGKSTWFSKGNIIEAILASSAVPPYYPPYKIGNVEYVDGGISNVIAIEEAEALKCKRVIAISTYDKQESGRIDNVFKLTGHVLHMLMRYKLYNELQMETKAFDRKNVIIIRPSIPSHFSITDFSCTKKLIKIGKKEAEDVLSGKKPAYSLG